MSKTFESEFLVLIEKYLGKGRLLTSNKRLRQTILVINKVIALKTQPRIKPKSTEKTNG